MPFLFHLLKKDFSALRLWLLITWATWGLFLLHPFLGTGSVWQSTVWLLLVNGAGWMMTLLTLARLLHLDPLPGSDQFLAVRPVSRGTLIASKLLFTALLLILPLFAIRVLHIVLLGFELSGSDYLLLIPGLLLPLTAAHLLLLLPSLFTRKTSSTFLVLIGAFVLVLFLLLGARQPVAFGGVPPDPAMSHLGSSRLHVVLFLFIACATWATASYAIARRWWHPVLAALCFVALSSATLTWWPWNFVHALGAQTAATSAEPPDKGNLRLVNTAISNNGQAWITSQQKGPIYLDTVEAPLQLKGIAAPWFARVDSFRSVARFGNGNTVPSYGAPYWSPDGIAPLRAATIKALGLSAPADGLHGIFDQVPGGYAVFRDDSDAWQRARAQSPLVSIEGHLTFTFARPKVLRQLPLRAGASATAGHTRYTIREAAFGSDRITLRIAIESGRVPLRGEAAPDGATNTLFLVTDPGAGTFYPVAHNGSSSFGGLGFYALSDESFSVDLPRSVSTPSPLRLCIVVAGDALKISLPFRLTGKELPQ